jgi:hypothetical protein
VIVTVNDRFVVCSRATLIDPDRSGLQAWAERHVRQDPDLRWIIGNYVEADEPNSNGHLFPLDELQQAKATLVGKPLNMLHREHYIVGYFAAVQLVHANGMDYEDNDVALAAAEAEHPYVEALAGMWHHRFPEEFFQIRRAHHDGTLFFSMETVPEKVSCPTCQHLAVYAGFESDTYCAHMQGAVGPKVLHNPVFNGGAIIIPPLKPGWNRADITAISQLISSAPEAPAVHDQVAIQAPELGPREWEQVMAQIILLSRTFKTDTRNKLADKGKAMPDGSFPIVNSKDLKNAIRAIGRAKDPTAAKQHIKKRAAALGLTKWIPPGW